LTLVVLDLCRNFKGYNIDYKNTIYVADIVCGVNIIPAGALVASAARASAGMIFTYRCRLSTTRILAGLALQEYLSLLSSL